MEKLKLTETEIEKISNAYRIGYLKLLPLWRIFFCSFESNKRWYDKRIKNELMKN